MSVRHLFHKTGTVSRIPCSIRITTIYSTAGERWSSLTHQYPQNSDWTQSLSDYAIPGDPTFLKTFRSNITAEGAPAGYYEIGQDVAVTPGEVITISGSYRFVSDGNSTGDIYGQVWWNTGGAPLNFLYVTGPLASPDWIPFSFDITVPAGATTGTFGFSNYTDGGGGGRMAEFKDLSLKKKD